METRQVQFAHPWTDPNTGISYNAGQLADLSLETARKVVLGGIARYTTNTAPTLIQPGLVDDVELLEALSHYEKRVPRDSANPGDAVVLGPDGQTLQFGPSSGVVDEGGQQVGGATSTTQGLIRLGGDLSGTANEPRVTGLIERLTLEQVQDAVATMLLPGSNISLVYDDQNGTLTVHASGTGGTGTGGGGTDPEIVRDTIGQSLISGTGVLVAVNDDANTIRVSADPEYIRDTVAAVLRAGAGMSVLVDDAADTITLSSSGSSGVPDQEIIRNTIGAALRAGSGVTIDVNDTADTITFSVSGFVPVTAIQTKGDLLAGSGPGGVARVPASPVNGYGLISDTTQPGGMRWAPQASGGGGSSDIDGGTPFDTSPQLVIDGGTP